MARRSLFIIFTWLYTQPDAPTVKKERLYAESLHVALCIDTGSVLINTVACTCIVHVGGLPEYVGTASKPASSISPITLIGFLEHSSFIDGSSLHWSLVLTSRTLFKVSDFLPLRKITSLTFYDVLLGGDTILVQTKLMSKAPISS